MQDSLVVVAEPDLAQGIRDARGRSPLVGPLQSQGWRLFDVRWVETKRLKFSPRGFRLRARRVRRSLFVDLSKPALEGFSIVLVGDFNPPILNPDWLAARGLIREEEAQDAKGVGVISQDLTAFSTAWLELEVTRERFAAHTSDPSNVATLSELVY